MIWIFEEENAKFNSLDRLFHHDVERLKTERKKERDHYIITARLFKNQLDSLHKTLSSLLEIENQMFHFEFETALKHAESLTKSYPDSLHGYEYQIRIHKALCQDPKEQVGTWQQRLPESHAPDLAIALLLALDLENWQAASLAQRLEAFQPQGDYAYLAPYLLSRLHLYRGDAGSNSPQEALRLAKESIDLVPADSTLACAVLTHHYVRCLLHDEQYTACEQFLEQLYEDTRPAHYRYLSHLAALVNPKNEKWFKDAECRNALEGILEVIESKEGLPPLFKVEGNDPNSESSHILQTHLDGLTDAMDELGWGSSVHQDKQRCVKQLIDQGRWSRRVLNLDQALREASGSVRLEVDGHLFRSGRRSGELDQEERHWGQAYRESPTALNAALLVDDAILAGIQRAGSNLAAGAAAVPRVVFLAMVLQYSVQYRPSSLHG